MRGRSLDDGIYIDIEPHNLGLPTACNKMDFPEVYLFRVGAWIYPSAVSVMTAPPSLVMYYGAQNVYELNIHYQKVDSRLFLTDLLRTRN